MSNQIRNAVMMEIVDVIDIPDSAYQTAEKRYRDLGEWMGREESYCFSYDPHVFPQGSFLLGTVIRPITGEDEYDLDLACKLENGISKATHTQKWLKILIGDEVEKFRNSRNIEEKIEEKHRCWRLNYKDQLKFHLDILPCIPEEDPIKVHVKNIMIQYGVKELLAEKVSAVTIAITDDRHANYNSISNDWNISNPKGYALWFESRMKQAEELLNERVIIEKATSIDDIPTYKWKTPLQQAIQILKRHRDVMFLDNPKGKPISIIITTLAAEAYQGETEVADAITNILTRMDNLISPLEPRIPNPVNPDEDFADKWSTPEGQRLNLENNFWNWLEQAKADSENIGRTDDVDFISEHAKERFGVELNSLNLKKLLGIGAPSIIIKPKDHEIKEPAKPWAK